MPASNLLSRLIGWKTGFLKTVSLFLIATLLLLALNIILSGSLYGSLGKVSHSFLGLLVITAFLKLYCKNYKDLSLVGLLWLVFSTPLLFTLFASPEQISQIRICENNVWALTLAIFLVSASSLTAFTQQPLLRQFFKVIVSACWLLALLPVVSFFIFLAGFDELLSPDIVIAVLQTHPSEAFEYLAFKGLPLIASLVFASLALIALGVVIARLNNIWTWPRSFTAFIVVATTCFLSLFASFKTVNNVTLSAFYNAFINIREMNRFKEGIEKRQEILYNLAKQGHSGRNGLFVFVIGESHTRDRMSAYYPLERNTTPWLKAMRQDNRFIMLEKGYTSYVSTVQALSYALTTKTQYTSQNFDDAPSIIEVVKASGYDTYWLSNQSKISPWDTPTAIIASCADHQTWLEKGLDEELLKAIPKDIQQPTVIFIQLMGSHTDYKERYSSSYKLWAEKDLTNAYDNSLRYNDWVLSQIYEEVKGLPDFQAMIYMADHGENPTIGHLPANFTWDMARIPIWFAFSDAFVQSYPETVSILRANAQKPFTNDMMFDTLCGVFGLKSWPFYEPKNDISSATYMRPVDELRTLYGKKRITADPNL